MQKPQIRDGTHRHNNSGGYYALLHAQNDRWGLLPLETCKSGPNVAVLNAQNHRWGLEPIETSYSGANHAVYMHKTTGEGWNSYRLVILVQITPLCIHQTASEVWDT